MPQQAQRRLAPQLPFQGGTAFANPKAFRRPGIICRLPNVGTGALGRCRRRARLWRRWKVAFCFRTGAHWHRDRHRSLQPPRAVEYRTLRGILPLLYIAPCCHQWQCHGFAARVNPETCFFSGSADRDWTLVFRTPQFHQPPLLGSEADYRIKPLSDDHLCQHLPTLSWGFLPVVCPLSWSLSAIVLLVLVGRQ